MMNYFRVIVPIPDLSEDIEVLTALMAMNGYDSFEETSSEFIAYIPEDDYDEGKLLDIEYLNKYRLDKSLKTEFVPDKNWNELWESNYPSVYITENCLVRAPFHDSDENVAYDIIIKPKMAFGTAHHETTSMMLELILKNDLVGKKVLDIGCGSGVLSVLASMKKASSVIAVDIDKWSFQNTLENIAINKITNIHVIQGGAEVIKDVNDFDIIFANINKNILLRDIKCYSDALVDGGFVYFSGFYSKDLKDITEMAKTNNLEYLHNLENNDWVACVFKKHII
jgi:ribosomal protein L11 methyltransferase|tara:strand:- start:3378 stop:4223 length:846 start_codon:yes stop_codon:yes gene_type:complete